MDRLIDWLNNRMADWIDKWQIGLCAMQGVMVKMVTTSLRLVKISDAPPPLFDCEFGWTACVPPILSVCLIARPPACLPACLPAYLSDWQWVSYEMSDWLSELVNQWVIQWVSQWLNEALRVFYRRNQPFHPFSEMTSQIIWAEIKIRYPASDTLGAIVCNDDTSGWPHSSRTFDNFSFI